jgi:outer membrane protein
LKKVLIPLIFCFFSFPSLFAQTNAKLGYINSDSLIPIIPGRDSVLKVIKAAVDIYEEQFYVMDLKYQSLYEAFNKDSSSLSSDTLKVKIVELLALKKKLNDFKSNAKESLQKQQDALLLPLIAKAQKAIADVAKEYGYIYIFDTSESNGMVLVYADKEGDIMPLIKKKLGIIK